MSLVKFAGVCVGMGFGVSLGFVVAVGEAWWQEWPEWQGWQGSPVRFTSTQLCFYFFFFFFFFSLFLFFFVFLTLLICSCVHIFTFSKCIRHEQCEFPQDDVSWNSMVYKAINAVFEGDEYG
jgi:hypothetical protein